jgi:DNA-binding transcriptional MerR regulator
MSRREAAAVAGVHYNTVRGWERDGRLRTKRVLGSTGPEVHVSVDDLETITAERPSRPTAEFTQDEAVREVQRLREANAQLQGEVNALRSVLSDVLHLARPDVDGRTDE